MLLAALSIPVGEKGGIKMYFIMIHHHHHVLRHHFSIRKSYVLILTACSLNKTLPSQCCLLQGRPGQGRQGPQLLQRSVKAPSQLLEPAQTQPVFCSWRKASEEVCMPGQGGEKNRPGVWRLNQNGLKFHQGVFPSIERQAEACVDVSVETLEASKALQKSAGGVCSGVG